MRQTQREKYKKNKDKMNAERREKRKKSNNEEQLLTNQK